MPSKTQKLVAAREVIQGQIARFADFLSNVSVDHTVEIEARLDRILPLFDEFNNIQAEIELSVNSDDELEQRITFEKQYFEAVAAAKRILAKFVVPTPSSHQQVSNSSHAKLPTLDLPKFKGNYETWTQFIETFNALVHQNNELDPIQKFYHLLGSLEGDAKRVIECLEVTRENYAIALDLLKRRFENKQIIIQAHLKAIVDMAPAHKESSSLLRMLGENLEKHLRALKALGEPVSEWDRLIILIMSRKLDPHSQTEWERETITRHSGNPKVEDFTKFIANKCNILDTMQASLNPGKSTTNKGAAHKPQSAHLSIENIKCHYCNASHFTYTCQKLLAHSVPNRIKEIRNAKLCVNCLRPNHPLKYCKAGKCRKCNQSHNTILHVESSSGTSATQESNVKEVAASATSCSCNLKPYVPTQTLLATAIVSVKASGGKFIRGRALLDSGSQVNFLSKSFLKKLGLSTSRSSYHITGIDRMSTHTQLEAKTTIKSLNSSYTAEVSFVILNEVTTHLPTQSFNAASLRIPPNLQMADPDFSVSSQVDLLLGAQIFYDCLCTDQIKMGSNLPVLQSSLLGWIIAGPMSMGKNPIPEQQVVSHLAIGDTLQNQLARFWELEECHVIGNKLSSEEQECENYFQKTTYRNPSGRFCVSIPFKPKVDQLGDSLDTAIKRFHMLEKKLSKNSILKEKYCSFISEYIDLGHMSKISDHDLDSSKAAKRIYYLPHHGVLNESSTTTKLRVVFDGSCKTSSDLSLNDVQRVGPKVQDDFFDILLRFRQHPVVLIADIEKMYRQVEIVSEQRDLQRVLWRFDPSEPIGHYRLNTVTYGTASASFLATRCLRQTAEDIHPNSELLSQIILKDFYVDDLITGTKSVEHAIEVARAISQHLSCYGFPLRKWASNRTEVLQALSTGASPDDSYLISEGDTKKTLGVQWRAGSDSLEYLANTDINNDRITKRSILSIISQIFDPLGLVGPVTIRAKILLQRLWLLGLGWDDSVPLDVESTWLDIYRRLEVLNQIEIPRLCISSVQAHFELHGFCDASELAYGACVYIRSTENEQSFVRLLCAKSKVAPLRSISLPRLELCGASVLSKLVKRVSTSLTLPFTAVHLWTDSTVVLAWLSSQPSNWKTFVANRVSEIQELTSSFSWHHVISRDNPADIISRGISPDKLKNSDLWFNGPQWLNSPSSNWPKSEIKQVQSIPERRKIKVSLHAVLIDNSLLKRYSTLYKLKRVVAFVIRFAKNLRCKSEDRVIGPLTSEELDATLFILIKEAQHETYPSEIKALTSGQFISKQSDIRSLDPFLDDDGLIRVGGRLQNSDLSYDTKYPIVLPANHLLTKLIIMDAHLKNLHAGPQAILNSLRQQYWPINAKNTIRRVLNKCITCFRVKPLNISQKMGNLPRERILPSRPFSSCGVDLAGPFNIKDGKLRNRSIVKGYMCLFICLSTKAVHIEVVGDLSADSFLNSLKRFTARRGNCKNLFSDNATNFLGADNNLKNFLKHTLKDLKDPEIIKFCVDNKIKWKTIPPRSPHQGGIWEAAIKSAKYHAKRVIGNSALTFEDLSTVFAQIEAILNSRPLIPISTNPTDLTALTPGHFLIGDLLTSPPHEDLRQIPTTRLKRYHQMEQMRQHFWQRWSREYLTTLQQRHKWQVPQANSIKIGSMVVLKDDNLPPLLWRLGRVESLHPGDDGLIRVVGIRTSNSSTKRAIHKVCLLPLEEEAEDTNPPQVQ